MSLTPPSIKHITCTFRIFNILSVHPPNSLHSTHSPKTFYMHSIHSINTYIHSVHLLPTNLFSLNQSPGSSYLPCLKTSISSDLRRFPQTTEAILLLGLSFQSNHGYCETEKVSSYLRWFPTQETNPSTKAALEF